MDEQSVTVSVGDEDSDETAEVSLVEISRAIGDAHIMEANSPDEREHGYLAAISVETLADDGYSVEDALIEYFNNASTFNQRQIDIIVAGIQDE